MAIDEETLTQTASISEDKAVLYKKVLRRLMPLLMVIYIVAFIDRSNVGFAKLGFMPDLGFTDTIFGIGAGIFYAGYMLFEIPSNLLLARIGARKTLVRIMLLWAICSAGFAAMSGPYSYYTWRFLLGASEAGLFPGVLLYLTYWVPSSRRARFTAMFMASIPLAGILAGPLSGTIMHAMEGVAGVRGWRWLFIIEGAPALLLAVVAYVWLRDRPSNAPWLTASEVATIQRDLDADAAAAERSGHKSFGDALRSPRFYLLVGMGVALLASVANVFFWLPTIIRTSGVKDVWVIGLMSAVPFVAGFIVQYLVARHSDLRDERRWHAAVSALFAAAGWCALTFVANEPVLALLAMTVAAAGTFATTGPFWAMPSLYLGRKAAAGGIALISTLAGIGSLISPVIVGWLNEQTKTLAAGQFFLAGLLVIGAVTVVAIGPHSVPRRKPSLSPAA